MFQLEQDPAATEASAIDAAWSASDDEGPKDPEAHRFAQGLVAGVRTNAASLDTLIETHSHNWRLDRMQRIDRNVLRLGVYELKHCADIPKKVTINEAIELAKRFGTEDSASFINGLLDRIAVAVAKE